MLDDGDPLTAELLADPFRRAARRLGVGIAGAATFDPESNDHTAVVDAIARARPDGLVLAADPFHGGKTMLKALRARLGSRLPIMAHFLFGFVPYVLKGAGPAAKGVYVASNDVSRSAAPLTPAAQRFVDDLGESVKQFLGVLEAGQAAELVVRAIARSDGSRASVLRALRTSNVKDGLLGTFRFDRNGDSTAPLVPIMRITGTTSPDADYPAMFRGSVLDRIVEVPASLVQ